MKIFISFYVSLNRAAAVPLPACKGMDISSS